MHKRILILIGIIILISGIASYRFLAKDTSKNGDMLTSLFTQDDEGGGPEAEKNSNPLQIEKMRNQEYPGSNVTIEQTLTPGGNYSRYIASYKSDGLKIFALPTIPQGQKPEKGWPAILFNHGYIPPTEYRTTERYIPYTDAFSRNGYIVFRPDYRGHGSSEGNPEGAYYSPAYTVDVLNAVSSIKKLKDTTFSGLDSGSPTRMTNPIVDASRIGMWGHSMGGSITLRSMVVGKDIKAGVIWAGVVASYEDLSKNWHRARPFISSQREQAFRRPGRQVLIDKYGSLEENPTFWHSIAPISYIKDISGPVQIHHGTADEEVPFLFSQRLDDALKNAGKTVEFYTYPGDDHNISGNLGFALQRSVDFFDKYLK